MRCRQARCRDRKAGAAMAMDVVDCENKGAQTQGGVLGADDDA